MNSLLRAIVTVALGAWVVTADAAASTLQIDTIYSNADGAVQYVVLRETAGLNGQQALAGQTLTVTHLGAVKTFTFPADLPSSATANRRVLIASQGLAALHFIVPDYVFPDQFLATDGATLTFAGSDQVSYGPLPTDGVNGIGRTGVAATNVATNFAAASVTIPPVPVTVIEYYDAARDHYFISSLQPDIDALDTHRIPGWARTGQSFGAYATQDSGGPAAQPVCRFYIPPQDGDSHFLSASVAECNAVLQLSLFNPAYAGYVYETASAFFIELPNLATGACAPATVPVYRLWNQRADSNHRYTTDPATKAQMIARGFAPEGYGVDAVAMCALAPAPVDLSLINLNGIVWTGTVFVAVAGGPNGLGLIFTSPDGIQWNVRSSGTPALRGVGWTGTEIVAVGAGGTILTSPDGYRWSTPISGATETLNSVASSGSELLIVGQGGVLLRSLDGVAWTRGVSKTGQNLNGVTWTGSRFVLVGDGGTIITVLPSGTTEVRVSGTAANLTAVATGSSGKIVTVGGSGTILTSADPAATWNPSGSGTNATLQAVAAADSNFITVGTGGKILTGVNGKNWIIAQSTTAIALSGVAWSGALYVAVGATGTFVTSPDGVTWTVY
jgi:hypothetical protein